MIFNVTGGGGGGLNLKVVGGTTQPTNPRENTIWINTATAITGYVLSPTQPETGAEGLVWLKTADSGVEINVGRKNAVLLHLETSKLYNGQTWVLLDGYIYKSEGWTQFGFTALYRDGRFIVNHTTKAINGNIAEADRYYSAILNGKSLVGEAYAVFGPFTLTEISTISMRAVTSISDITDNIFAILVSKSNNATRNNAELKLEEKIISADVETVTIDVSQTTGDNWYVYVGTNTGGSKWSIARNVSVLEVSLE